MSGAVTWHEADRPRAASLDRERPTTVGRAEGAGVRVNDSSVSREQALIRFDGTGFVLANRSGTNPTRVNGRPADAETSLRDQDELLVGAVRVRFHDLSARDAISGPVCSHCGRENKSTDKDCWFCGTSLVSAASVLRQRRLVVGRLVAEDGQFVDLYDGQNATLGSGPPELRQQASATGAPAEVTATGEGLALAAAESVTVNGSPATAGQTLRTGDLVETAGIRYLAIVR